MREVNLLLECAVARALLVCREIHSIWPATTASGIFSGSSQASYLTTSRRLAPPGPLSSIACRRPSAGATHSSTAQQTLPLEPSSCTGRQRPEPSLAAAFSSLPSSPPPSKIEYLLLMLVPCCMRAVGRSAHEHSLQCETHLQHTQSTRAAHAMQGSVYDMSARNEESKRQRCAE